jgi:flagella basal body P-ring formation protein FlgA
MLRDKVLFIIFLAMAVALSHPCESLAVASQLRSPVEGQLTEFVKQIYGDIETDVNFNLPSQLRGDPRIRNISFSKVPDLSGDGICLVCAESKSGTEVNVYVPFKVLVKRSLYSLKSNMKKGDVLRSSDLTTKQTYVTGGRNGYPQSIDDVLGKSLKKEMVAGEIITTQALEDHVAVLKGEVVSMTVENNRLLVQAKGIALEKGKMGDIIRVKSSSGREVIGRITASNSVIVQF